MPSGVLESIDLLKVFLKPTRKHLHQHSVASKGRDYTKGFRHKRFQNIKTFLICTTLASNYFWCSRGLITILSNIYDRGFCENSYELLGVKYFSKKAPSKMSDRFLKRFCVIFSQIFMIRRNPKTFSFALSVPEILELFLYFWTNFQFNLSKFTTGK